MKRTATTTSIALPVWTGLRDSACSRCDLARPGLKTVCVPSRVWPDAKPLPVHTKCVYVIGEAPAVNEDESGRPFVGEAGGILSDWLTACNFPETVDVVLSNTVRCMLPPQTKPNKTQIQACMYYTKRELKGLRRLYPGPNDLVVLLLGAFACQTIGFSTLKSAFKCQGQTMSFGEVQCPVFLTYHPSSTRNDRSPENMWAVMDHLDLLCRFLRDEPIWAEERDESPWQTVNWNPKFPDREPKRVAVDIETFGLLKGQSQTVFHPRRARYTDNVTRKNLIVTVSVATDAGLCGAFRWADPLHRASLYGWLDRCQKSGIPLVFKNGVFDLSWLRESDPRFREVLNYRTRVEDLDVYNYLYSDVRPENSLKDLSVLNGLAHYRTKDQDGNLIQYDSDDDPGLVRYNQKDAYLTLKNRDRLVEQIQESFPGSPKLSDRTLKYYSDLIWLCVHMSEAGVALNIRELKQKQTQWQTELDETLKTARGQYGLILQGKGSQGHIQDLIVRAAGSVDMDSLHQELKYTDTGLLSSTEGNIQTIMAELPTDHRDRHSLEMLLKVRKLSKLLSTYIGPIIGNPMIRGGFRKLQGSKGRLDERKVAIGRIVYPIWRPVPSGGAGWGDTAGGTKQGRITCVNPPLQTYPRIIKSFMTPQRPDGFMLWSDLNQIELRVAAYVSNDTDMLEEYAMGVDRHWLRAVEIFQDEGGVCPVHGNKRDKKCDTCDLRRQLSKTVNFTIVYRGTWRRLVQSAWEDLGYRLDKWKAATIVQKARTRYPKFNAWQDELIRQVTRDGYWYDPILGQGRRYTQSYKINRSELESRIVNCPIQHDAALLMTTAQIKVMQELERTRRPLLTRTIHNVYDAMVVEGPRSELSEVLEIVQDALRETWYLKALEDHYQRPFPMAAETKVLLFKDYNTVQSMEIV